jgi:hypothetical protein
MDCHIDACHITKGQHKQQLLNYEKKKKTWRVSLSIGIRITMIRCVVNLVRIFKIFLGLMSNPVLLPFKNVHLLSVSQFLYPGF